MTLLSVVAHGALWHAAFQSNSNLKCHLPCNGDTLLGTITYPPFEGTFELMFFRLSRLVGYVKIPCKVNDALGKRRVDVDSKMERNAASNRMWMTICRLWLLWFWLVVGCA